MIKNKRHTNRNIQKPTELRWFYARTRSKRTYCERSTVRNKTEAK